MKFKKGILLENITWTESNYPSSTVHVLLYSAILLPWSCFLELTSSSINATKPAFTSIQMDSSLIVQLANNLETEKYYCFVVPSGLCTKKYHRLLSTMLMCSIFFFCLLTAVKKLVLGVVHTTLSIKEINTDFHSMWCRPCISIGLGNTWTTSLFTGYSWHIRPYDITRWCDLQLTSNRIRSHNLRKIE